MAAWTPGLQLLCAVRPRTENTGTSSDRMSLREGSLVPPVVIGWLANTHPVEAGTFCGMVAMHLEKVPQA
jgi:hypothetical protein